MYGWVDRWVGGCTRESKVLVVCHGNPYPAPPASVPPCDPHAADGKAVLSASSGWPLCLRTTAAVGPPGGGGKGHQLGLEFKSLHKHLPSWYQTMLEGTGTLWQAEIPTTSHSQTEPDGGTWDLSISRMRHGREMGSCC